MFESGKDGKGGEGRKWERASMRGYQTREPTRCDSFSQCVRMRTHPRNNVLDVD